MAQIELLKQEIAKLQVQLALQLGTVKTACSSISFNLFLGIKGEEVNCLQEFLKAQGGGIYPEGLVTGNFGPLTLNAVIRFQERYAEEVLAPIGFEKGIGDSGSLTGSTINPLITPWLS